MVLPDSAVGPLVGPSQGASVFSACLTASWALAWAAGQPLGPVAESPSLVDEPRSQPARTVTAANRAAEADRAVKKPGVALRLRCTGAPRGGMSGGCGRGYGGGRGVGQGVVPVVPPSWAGGYGGGGGPTGESRAATAPVRRRRAE